MATPSIRQVNLRLPPGGRSDRLDIYVHHMIADELGLEYTRDETVSIQQDEGAFPAEAVADFLEKVEELVS